MVIVDAHQMALATAQNNAATSIMNENRQKVAPGTENLKPRPTPHCWVLTPRDFNGSVIACLF